MSEKTIRLFDSHWPLSPTEWRETRKWALWMISDRPIAIRDKFVLRWGSGYLTFRENENGGSRAVGNTVFLGNAEAMDKKHAKETKALCIDQGQPVEVISVADALVRHIALADMVIAGLDRTPRKALARKARSRPKR